MVQKINEVTKKRLEQFCIECNDFMKKNFVPEPDEFLTQYRYDRPMLFNRSMKEITVSGVQHVIDRRPEIDYLNMHDTDVVDILKDMIRRAEK